ncbi:hypothetical protein GCM10023149_14840 [Mucilaginibacter gynuensis]|uniref:ATP-binding protein n=1 Tax=Mucilaginibacter gynuensis TaxID=1302236 RepID=A0ABP8G4R1_9SPHI
MPVLSQEKNIHRTNKVFVPGGLPKLTYNPRNSLDLEKHLRKANDNLCKLVMVTGSTKSGKTVLTKTVFEKGKSVWFDGGAFNSEEDLWNDIAEQLELSVGESRTQSTSNNSNIVIGAGLQTSLFPVKGKIDGSKTDGTTNANSVTKTTKRSAKALCLEALNERQTPLVIDDFHYIPRTSQGNIVRALKAVIYEGAPVIFLAIPHRRLDAVKVEREMTGRVETIQVPVWELEELCEIARIGFPLLNVKVSSKIIDSFANEAIGSPHLMQEFCRELCSANQIDETLKLEKSIEEAPMDMLFKKVAIGTGKIMFDKLSKGPRQRSDRIQRTLKDGRQTDIYGLVLQALAEIKPGMAKVDYEELRTKMRDIISEKPPAAHEISRVLDHMSNIASSDESSTPVLDWEKEDRTLHITDPFFAYYLRWGIETTKHN